jgi:segregation and condensation protein B
MTLRRFVRVTIDNFRQLLQTISAPTTSLPMPTIVPLPPPNASLQPIQEPANQPASQLEAGAPAPVAALHNDGAQHAAHADEQAAGEHAFNHAASGDATAEDDARTDAGVLAVSANFSAADRTDFDGEPDSGGAVAGDPGETTSEPANEAAGEDAGDQVRESEKDAAALTPAAFTLAGALESLLFVADEAVEPAQLARAIGITPAAAEAALLALDADYRSEGRGLRLQVRNGRYQLVTAPEAANLIENFLNLDASARLSAPALEALAVVAYRQPVTRAQIEAVRGVDCSGVLRSLLQRGLLEEVGRLDAPGRPVLYGVTDLFMHHFGLTALQELPPLEDAEIARIEEMGA